MGTSPQQPAAALFSLWLLTVLRALVSELHKAGNSRVFILVFRLATLFYWNPNWWCCYRKSTLFCLHRCGRSREAPPTPNVCPWEVQSGVADSAGQHPVG